MKFIKLVPLNLFLISSIVLGFSGCFRTTEQIQREQELDQVASETKQSRGLLADLTSRIKELEEQNNSLNGKIESLEHQQTQNGSGRMEDLEKLVKSQNEELSLLKGTLEELKKSNSELDKNFKSQAEFIKDTNSTLKSIAQSGSLQKANTYSSSKDKNKKKNETKAAINSDDSDNNQKEKTKGTVESAEKLLEKNKLSEAIELCQEITSHNDLSEGKKNRCRFVVGKAQHQLGKYDDSLLVLSQLYSEWPKSSLAAPSLLQMAKSLSAKKQEKQSQLMLKKLIKEYPQSEASKEAEKLLKN